MFTGCAVGIRKTVIDKIGLRPKNFFTYASEADISIRALDAGFLIEHCEDIEAFHKESPVKRLSPKFYYYNTRNIIWLCKILSNFQCNKRNFNSFMCELYSFH